MQLPWAQKEAECTTKASWNIWPTMYPLASPVSSVVGSCAGMQNGSSEQADAAPSTTAEHSPALVPRLLSQAAARTSPSQQLRQATQQGHHGGRQRACTASGVIRFRVEG